MEYEEVDENEGYDSEDDRDQAKEISTLDTMEDERIVDFLGGEKPEPFFFGVKKPKPTQSLPERKVSLCLLTCR